MNAPKINLPEMTEQERLTAEAEAAAAASLLKAEVVTEEVTAPESTVTKATKGTAPSRWNISGTAYGVRAVHESGEIFYGSTVDFNKHLKA